MPLPSNSVNYLYLGSKPLNYSDDPVGSNVSAAQYYPYGQLQSGTTSTQTQAFGSYVQDESGLLYADQRYFNQTWVRFLMPDPSEANVDPTSSIAWNHYAYANADPLGGNDSSGLLDRSNGDTSTSCFAGGGPDPNAFTGSGTTRGVGGEQVFVGPNGAGFTTPGQTFTLITYENACSVVQEFCNGAPNYTASQDANDPAGNLLVGVVSASALNALGGVLSASATGTDGGLTYIVNLGGEAYGAINVQPPAALGEYWTSATGQTFSELTAGGDTYVVADPANLPFAPGTLDIVITNSTPVDVPSFLGNGWSSTSIVDSLAPGGQWISDQVVTIKPCP